MTNFETLEQLADYVDYKAHLVRDEFFDKGVRNGQNHWTVCIACNGRFFSTNYSQGSAHRTYRGKPLPYNCTNERMIIHSVPSVPKFLDVMYCLVSDAGCVDCSTFNDFCDELGYDNDSISDRKAYDACCDTRAELAGMGFCLDNLRELFAEY